MGGWSLVKPAYVLQEALCRCRRVGIRDGMDPDVDQPCEGREIWMGTERCHDRAGRGRLVVPLSEGYIIGQCLPDSRVCCPGLELDNLLSARTVDHGVYLPLAKGFLLFLVAVPWNPVYLPLPDRDGCPELVDAVCPGLVEILGEDLGLFTPESGVLPLDVGRLDCGVVCLPVFSHWSRSALWSVSMCCLWASRLSWACPQSTQQWALTVLVMAVGKAVVKVLVDGERNNQAESHAAKEVV